MYPMFFNPHFEEKVWGGNALRDNYGKSPDIQGPLGESWEISAMPEKESVVKNGKYAGIPLSQLYEEHPKLFGTNVPQFPLLVKFIDAKDWLSVQVHSGQRKTGVFKTEAWYILSADENAQLAFGTSIETKDELRAAIAAGTLASHLEYKDVRPGEVYFIPPGTLHAIGAGIVLYEIQTPSNVTFRLHHFKGARTTHIELGVEAYDNRVKSQKIQPIEQANGETLLVETGFFELRRVDADAERVQGTSDRFLIYTALGDGRAKKGDEVYTYRKGDSFIIPAWFGEFTLHGGVLLKAYVPDSFVD